MQPTKQDRTPYFGFERFELLAERCNPGDRLEQTSVTEHLVLDCTYCRLCARGFSVFVAWIGCCSFSVFRLWTNSTGRLVQKRRTNLDTAHGFVQCMVVSSLSCQSKSVLGVLHLDRLEGRVAKAGSNTSAARVR